MKTQEETEGTGVQSAVAEKMRKLMDEQKITIIELSARTGISRPNIYALLKGKSDVRLGTLEKIASALKVSISNFFTDDIYKKTIYEELVGLYRKKTTILELQLSFYQKDRELTRVRGLAYQNDDQESFVVTEGDSKSTTGSAVKSEPSDTIPESDPGQVAEVLRELSKQIARCRLLLLELGS